MNMILKIIYIVILGMIFSFFVGFIVARHIEADKAFHQITEAENETRYYRNKSHRLNSEITDLKLKLKKYEEEIAELKEKVRENGGEEK